VLALNSESIFRIEMLKILLQHYLPQAVVSKCSNVCVQKTVIQSPRRRGRGASVAQ
jgi:hypothetical protein